METRCTSEGRGRQASTSTSFSAYGLGFRGDYARYPKRQTRNVSSQWVSEALKSDQYRLEVWPYTRYLPVEPDECSTTTGSSLASENFLSYGKWPALLLSISSKEGTVSFRTVDSKETICLTIGASSEGFRSFVLPVWPIRESVVAGGFRGDGSST